MTPASSEDGKPWKKRGAEKPAITLKPGEVVVGRRLYRSGQSEYLINGRVARLRDVQEIFMGIGLGPDSYAIIEQGRIGQILNSKPMDRRAIIEEAAGITMYKTKRRLAEAKLEASKINLSRVNDILVEVEKQLASLKRQASKARRYAELREQMRGLLRIVLASKAEHLDIEAARLENLLREMDAAEEREARSVHELEAEQERLSARTYELDAELRQTQNLLGQTALDLDRAENRITFNREQAAQIESRAARAGGGNRAGGAAGGRPDRRAWPRSRSGVRASRADGCARSRFARSRREQAFGRAPASRSSLKRAWKSCGSWRGGWWRNRRASRPNRCRRRKRRRGTPRRKSSATAAMRAMEAECARLRNAVEAADETFICRPSSSAQEMGAAVREAQARLGGTAARRSRKPASNSSARAKSFPPNARGTLPSSRFCASALTPRMPCRNFSAPTATQADTPARLPRRGLAGGLRRGAGRIRSARSNSFCAKNWNTWSWNRSTRRARASLCCATKWAGARRSSWIR